MISSISGGRHRGVLKKTNAASVSVPKSYTVGPRDSVDPIPFNRASYVVIYFSLRYQRVPSPTARSRLILHARVQDRGTDRTRIPELERSVVKVQPLHTRKRASNLSQHVISLGHSSGCGVIVSSVLVTHSLFSVSVPHRNTISLSFVAFERSIKRGTNSPAERSWDKINRRFKGIVRTAKCARDFETLEDFGTRNHQCLHPAEIFFDLPRHAEPRETKTVQC